MAQKPLTDSSLRQLVGTVLLAEEDPALTQFLQTIIASLGYLVTVTNSRDAFRGQLRFTWDLIIVDLSLKEWGNLVLLEDIRGTVSSSATPCFVFAGTENIQFVVECLKLGALDYVTRLTEPELVVAKLQAQLRYSSMVRGLLKNSKQLQRLAAFDELTRVYNRHTIKRVLADELQRATDEHSTTAILLVDMDQFEQINESHGHDTGDDVLIQFANVMQNFFRTGDTVGRYGGAEFCAILPRTSCSEATATAERLRETVLHQPLDCGSQKTGCTVSIGIACAAADHHVKASAMLRIAHNALSESKRQGGNQVVTRHTDPVRDAITQGTTRG